MNKLKTIRILLLIVSLFLIGTSSSMACFITEVEWEGSVDGDWNNPDNYSDGNLPSGFEVVIVNALTYTNAPVVSTNSAFTPFGVQLDNNATLTVNANLEMSDFEIEDGNNNVINVGSGATLTMNDDFHFFSTGGVTINGDGEIDIGDDLRFDEANTELINNLTGTFTVGDNLSFESANTSLTNNGNMNIGGDVTAAGTGNNANDILNSSGAVFNIAGDFDFNGAANNVYNDGVINLDGSFIGINSLGRFENRSNGRWNWNYTGGTWDGDIISSFSENGIFVYNANGAQNVVPFDYTELEIAGSGIKTLVSNVQVSGQLTLTSGQLALGSYDLVIGANGMINGGSSSSYIIQNGNGTLTQQNLGNSGRTGAILFPVGTASSYTPLILDNSGGTADDFSVRVIDEVFIDGNSGTPQTTDVVARTWFIEELTAGGSSADLTFQWSASDVLGIVDPSEVHIIHHNGTYWEQIWSGNASGSDPYTASVTGVSDFSPFAVEGASGPLPVELIYFAASPKDDNVEITWATASELNNDHFIVERSSSLNKFEAIEIVEGQGTTTTSHSYKIIDHKPLGGSSYYRLTQVDYDGNSTTYQPVNVLLSLGEIINASLYPNPSNGNFINLKLSGIEKTTSTYLQILTLQGRLIFQQPLVIEENEVVEKRIPFVQSLAPGMYVLKINTPEPIVKRFNVE